MKRYQVFPGRPTCSPQQVAKLVLFNKTVNPGCYLLQVRTIMNVNSDQSSDRHISLYASASQASKGIVTSPAASTTEEPRYVGPLLWCLPTFFSSQYSTPFQLACKKTRSTHTDTPPSLSLLPHPHPFFLPPSLCLILRFPDREETPATRGYMDRIN